MALVNKETSEHDNPNTLTMNGHISKLVRGNPLFFLKILRLSVELAIFRLDKKWGRSQKGLRRRG